MLNSADWRREERRQVEIPREVCDMIISYICDLKTLLSCARVSKEWFLIVVPYLTIKTSIIIPHTRWFFRRPRQEPYKLVCPQVVKRYHIVVDDDFTPEQLRKRDFSHFRTLENLQELGIEHLNLSSFIPYIEKHFGRFALTLQSLTLYQPNASCREILYFIGFFKTLRDLNLDHFYPKDETEATKNLVLIRPSMPPLNGRLTLISVWGGLELVEEMIKLYDGKLNFRRVDLIKANCTEGILKACAGTLKTLQLHGDYLGGNSPFLESYLNLVSNCKSLRTLRISVPPQISQDHFPDFLRTVISDIPPLNIVLVYNRQYFSAGCDNTVFGSPAHVGWEKAQEGVKCPECDQQHLLRFKELWKIYKQRKFGLVLCAEVPGSMVDCAIEILERNVMAHKDGELGALLSQTSVISTVPPLGFGY